MENVERIDEKRGCACRGERGGDFRTDLSAFSDTCHDDFAVAAIDEFHGAVELLVEFRNEVEHGLRFVADDLNGIFFGRFHIFVEC